MANFWAKTPNWIKPFFSKKFVWNINNNTEPSVYFTFDDGPHPQATPYVLEQLDKYSAKATFFCVGNNVVKYPEIYQQVLEKGHSVGNHTYNHLNGWKTDTQKYLQNIYQARAFINSNLFRPPYGKIKREQLKSMYNDNPTWNICMWDVLSFDFDRKLSPEKCLENVIKNIQPGSIVLFHDSTKAWDRMSYALPFVLEFCKSKNWKMKKIEQ